jgi:hypothetical protein
MSKRHTLLWTSVAAVSLALAGSAALAASNPGTSARVAAPETTVFTVVERATTDVVVYVNPAEDDVIGNTLGFGNDLYGPGNKKKIGRDEGFCYRTNPGKSWECTWTNLLSDGRITVQGVFPDSLRDSRLAITGGTGAYQNARGYMLLHARNAKGTAFDFTFHVIR